MALSNCHECEFWSWGGCGAEPDYWAMRQRVLGFNRDTWERVTPWLMPCPQMQSRLPVLPSVQIEISGIKFDL